MSAGRYFSCRLDSVTVVDAAVCELAATPTYTLAGIASTCEPIEVQVVPSDEKAAVKVLPLRVSFNHDGTPGVHECCASVVAPPLVARTWKAAPTEGVRPRNTFGDPAVRFSRNMM